MAIVFGLLAALLWGVTDFLIRVIGRSVGVHRSMLYAQGVGAVSVGLWLPCSPAARWPLHDPSPTALAAALGASPLGVLATLALYRGLQVGRVGLVSPIAGAYGAVSAALSLASGETIGRPAIAGIAAVVVGGLLVSIPARDASGVRDGGSSDGRAAASKPAALNLAAARSRPDAPRRAAPQGLMLGTANAQGLALPGKRSIPDRAETPLTG